MSDAKFDHSLGEHQRGKGDSVHSLDVSVVTLSIDVENNKNDYEVITIDD